MLTAVKSMQSFARLLAVAIRLGALRDTSRRMDLQPDAQQTELVEINKSMLVVDQVWRWVIGIAVIPAVIAIIARLTIPETPRYYADIMKDLRKAVKNALRIYGRTKRVEETNSLNSGPTRQNSDQNDHWFTGAWVYLNGKSGAMRKLTLITMLWGLMDIGFCGLSMDSPSVLATLKNNPSTTSTSSSTNLRRSETCVDASNWRADSESPDTTIYHMLENNSIRSILILSIASLAGSISAIIIVNRFHRKRILIVTFLVLVVLFGITGGTLISSHRTGENHVPTIAFYAITQFVYNLRPNTMILVLAAEIFPTVYRGTFYGIAASGGKLGAIIIRAIIGATGNQEVALGVRPLLFIPVMLLAAGISWFLPDVQYAHQVLDTDTAVELQPQNEQDQLAEHAAREGRQASDGSSSDIASSHSRERHHSTLRAATKKPYGFFSQLQNMTLEEIAPNPSMCDNRKRKNGATGVTENLADHAGSSGGMNPVSTGALGT